MVVPFTMKVRTGSLESTVPVHEEKPALEAEPAMVVGADIVWVEPVGQENETDAG